MEMFIHVDEIVPLCQEIGFENIKIDDSNSLMQHEIEYQEEEEPEIPEEEMCSHAKKALEKERAEKKKHAVHRGSIEFEHLKEYDMNQLCARVVAIAQKPLK